MTKIKEVSVGILFVSSLVGVLVLTLTLKDTSLYSLFGGDKHEYTIYFDQANEIKEGDSVLIMGMHQGEVTSVKALKPRIVSEGPLSSEPPTELCVEIMVKMDMALMLRKSAQITIRDANMLGGKVLDIKLGEGEPIADNEMLVGRAKQGMLTGIGDLIDKSGDDLKKILEDLRKCTDQVTKGEGLMGKLFFSDETAADFEEILDKLNRFSGDLNNPDSVIAMFTKDKETSAQLKEVLDNLAKISRNAAGTDGSLGKLINSSEAHDSLMATMENVESVTARLDKGEGFLGKLMSDESNKVWDDFEGILADSRSITNEIVEGKGFLNDVVFSDEFSEKVNEIAENIRVIFLDLKDGKGALGVILRNEGVAEKLEVIMDRIEKIADHLLNGLEDAREAAPLNSLGSFLFGMG